MGSWCPVNPDTLGQTTGLFDKNGKEIFEGDILGIETDEGILNVNVFWDDKHALFMFESEIHNEKELLAELVEDNAYPFEVVGDIYQNPELLEVTE
ncbi:YopX family protein [uncultured Streptococcus sp.]|uniref:YopX family protein n=1 Tax=uncultured Streptococcus sp. TaxID=83427 RepID=UPI00321194BF